MVGTQLSAARFVYHRSPFSISALWDFSKKRGGTTLSFEVMRLVPFNLYAKRGYRISVLEGLATQYISENTTIPVPRMLDVISLGPGLGNFLLMTAVEGNEYESTGVALDDMPESQRAVFTETLRGWFEQLVVYHHRMTIPSLGPFTTQDAFHAQDFCQTLEPYNDELRAALEERTKKTYRICFTHGDVNPHNILVDRDIQPCALVDWECAGWMPEYWEYTRTLYLREECLGWKQVFTDIFPDYDTELTVEKAVWAHYLP